MWSVKHLRHALMTCSFFKPLCDDVMVLNMNIYGNSCNMVFWYALEFSDIIMIQHDFSLVLSPLPLQVHVQRDKVTWPGAKIQKSGEGMPNYDNNKIRGTLYITVDVDFPRRTFSDEEAGGLLVVDENEFVGGVYV